jgi:hypothetical protein
LRAIGSAFSDTRYVTLPSPWPSTPAVIATHGDWLLAVHPHSRATAIFTSPVPPPGPKLGDEFVIEGWQRVAVGPVTFVVAELPHAIAVSAARAEPRNSRGRELFLTSA